MSMPSLRLICLTLSLIVGLVLPQPGLAYPAKVKKLRVIDKTSSKITVTWKNQKAASSYQLRVLKSTGKLLKKYKVTTNKKTVKKLDANTLYKFKVRAKFGKKFAHYSKTLSARTKIEQPDDLLFGFWGLNGYISEAGLADVSGRFNSTVFQVASASPTYAVNTLLPLVRSSGMKVTLRMAGDHDDYTTGNDFDLSKWKNEINDWEGSGVQEFIDDGTLVGHMILDDIDTFTGIDPTAEDLDEMARYSQELLPGLMTFVRQKASNVPTPDSNDQRYVYLDAVVNQYTNYSGFSDGDIDEYVTTQTAAAEELGLGIINGLNIADGGDGSSDQPGASSGKYAMSAAEITDYGQTLLAAPNVQLFLMWEYDSEQLWSDGSIGSDYFDRTDVQAALAGLGELASTY